MISTPGEFRGSVDPEPRYSVLLPLDVPLHQRAAMARGPLRTPGTQLRTGSERKRGKQCVLTSTTTAKALPKLSWT